MNRIMIGVLLASLAATVTSDTTQATGAFFWKERSERDRSPSREKSFRRVGTLGNYLQYDEDAADETISEIVSATADGNTLVYTDGVRESIGFIDITDAGNPQPLGVVMLDPIPGDDTHYVPTSVDVLGNQYALVGANTSASLTNTSGKLVVVNIATRAVVTEIDLGGQPDSVKISPDGKYVAIAIENERNESLCAGGAEDGTEADETDCIAGGGVPGGLPQTPYGNPAGFLAVIRLTGPPLTWGPSRTVNLTGLSAYAPEDPEPEFVDINDRNEAVVTLQENNHLVIVDLATLAIKEHFGMGTVTLNGVDADDDGVISLTDTLADVPREPDAVAWVPGPFGKLNVATANEGDLFGGSRGFSIFRRNGAVMFDSGTSFEELAVRHGHYPEDRSDNKGTEPESIGYARFGQDDYLFVGAERGSFIAVYTLDRSGRPTFEQLLPGPLGPEGLLPIPQRNLLVASGETDLGGVNVRSTVMIYELERGKPSYPQILSEDDGGSPIPWSALSGMVSIPWQPESLLAVWDSAYSESNVFRIDVSERPAVVTDVLTLNPTDGTGGYDPEGIAIAPDETLWIASEGDASDTRPNLLLKVDLNGNVIKEIGLPPKIIACRAATTRRGTLGSGFEGIAVLPSGIGGRDKQREDGRHEGHYRLLVAQQRGWDYTTSDCEDLDDDGGGLNASNEPNRTRLWIYDPRADTWDHLAWELAPKPANASWVGLSEITEVPGGDYILIERDNRSGDFAVLKTLAKIGRHAFADKLIRNGEKAIYDLLPNLLATNGWITDKPEGVAVTSTGQLYVVTDNDAVEGWSGETWFFSLGRYWRLFR